MYPSAPMQNKRKLFHFVRCRIMSELGCEGHRCGVAGMSPLFYSCVKHQRLYAAKKTMIDDSSSKNRVKLIYHESDEE